jgi:acetylornithine deacetylase/succinyl-diaminopimelate desuccinylase-like protein
MRSLKTPILAAIVAGSLQALAASQPADVGRLQREPAVSSALKLARQREQETIADQIRFCETPAAPFKEARRAALLRRAFTELGLRDVRIGHEGNVLGERPGSSARPHLVVAAHLDTVFPEDTDVRVKRTGSILRGPGIGDNCRGLAVLVAVARVMRDAGVRTPGTITFAANVGEEGLGDLRGVKALFGVGTPDASPAPPSVPIDRFLSIDGTGLTLTNVAVGSHRYRVTFTGPGGHSFAAFGTANPATALGRAAAKIGDLQVPATPRTTFNIGRIGGGTSVNAIPSESWMEVDLRSSDPRALLSLDARMRAAIDAAVAEENARWGTPGAVTAKVEMVGERPAGSTPFDTPIVRAAMAAAGALGLNVGPGEGSTDSNIPMSLGIPAITIGAGGNGGDAHALTEWFDETDSWKGTQYALLVTLALAQP